LEVSGAGHEKDALSVKEAELAMMRRLGASESSILVAQGNLACTYARLGLFEKALSMDQDIYRGRVKFNGEEDINTLNAASNYANSLTSHLRFKEAKALLRKTIPVARRVHGENDENTLKILWSYAMALYKDRSSTLDDIREAVTTLEESERTARRVLGSAHPVTVSMEGSLREAQAVLLVVSEAQV